MNLIEKHAEKFEQLFTEFKSWNEKINLSAIREKDDVFKKHFEDSLLPMEFFDFDNKNVLDIGTGGGYPLLPLAVANPNSNFMGVDSVGKKLKAVQAIADELELKVATTHGRIEELGRDKDFREQFDLVTARALAPWPVLLEYALPFVKVGGTFLAYQGPAIKEDLENFKNLENKLGGEIIEIKTLNLDDSERIFVIIKKVKKTLPRYPRENGVPRMTPLK